MPFAPDDRDPVAELEAELDRAERERADLHDRAGQLDDRSGGRRGGELHLQPPRRPRLLDLFEPFQVVAGLIDLAAQGVRPPPVGAARLTCQLALASERVRLAAPVLEQRRVPAFLVDVVGIGGLVLGACARTRRLVLRPRAAVLVDAPRLGFDLHHAIDRPVEEVAIMGDEHNPGGQPAEKALEPCEAGEVEVVGRFVQEEHVEAREQDRGERRPCGLAAGEGLHLTVRAAAEPDVVEHRRGAGVEVLAAQREEAIEGVGVCGREVVLVCEPDCEVVHLLLGRTDSGASREVAADGLARDVPRAPAAGSRPRRR